MSIIGVNNIEVGTSSLRNFTKWLNPDIDQNTNKSTFKDAFIGGVLGALTYPVFGLGGILVGALGGLFSKANDRLTADITSTNSKREVTEVVLKGIDEHARDSACSCVAHLDETTGLMHIAKGKRIDESLLSWMSLGKYGTKDKSLAQISEDDAREILEKGKEGKSIAGYTGDQLEVAKRLNQVAHLPEVRKLIETWTKKLAKKDPAKYITIKNYFQSHNENIYNSIIVKVDNNKKTKQRLEVSQNNDVLKKDLNNSVVRKNQKNISSASTWSFIKDKATLDHLERIEKLREFTIQKQNGYLVSFQDLDAGAKEYYAGVLSSKFGLNVNPEKLSIKDLIRLLQGLEEDKLTALGFALSRYRDELKGNNQVVQGISNRHKLHKAIVEVFEPYGIAIEKFNAYDGDQRDMSKRIAMHTFDALDNIRNKDFNQVKAPKNKAESLEININ